MTLSDLEELADRAVGSEPLSVAGIGPDEERFEDALARRGAAVPAA